MKIDANWENLKYAIIFWKESHNLCFKLVFYDANEYGAGDEIELNFSAKKLRFIANALDRLKKTRNKKRIYKITFDDSPSYRSFDKRDGKYHKYSKIPDKKIITIKRIKNEFDYN